jgi:molybdenum cofactor biosynthesis enzyme MoaA
VVCISGGEPILFLDQVKRVCERAEGKFIVLYTNGTKMTPQIAGDLAAWGVNAINVGLHQPSTFHPLIRKVYNSFQGLQVSLRFHLEDTHTDIALHHPGLSFRFWHRDDCERDNEDRVVLTEA